MAVIHYDLEIDQGYPFSVTLDFEGKQEGNITAQIRGDYGGELLETFRTGFLAYDKQRNRSITKLTLSAAQTSNLPLTGGVYDVAFRPIGKDTQILLRGKIAVMETVTQ